MGFFPHLALARFPPLWGGQGQRFPNFRAIHFLGFKKTENFKNHIFHWVCHHRPFFQRASQARQQGQATFIWGQAHFKAPPFNFSTPRGWGWGPNFGVVAKPKFFSPQKQRCFQGPRQGQISISQRAQGSKVFPFKRGFHNTFQKKIFFFPQIHFGHFPISFL